ncbi:hypothetical protein SLIQ_11720 [Serratia liquefaciens FK01]|nr:hypothetical protein SLIQ_11720 [Serratia liquefaciens FK01]
MADTCANHRIAADPDKVRRTGVFNHQLIQIEAIFDVVLSRAGKTAGDSLHKEGKWLVAGELTGMDKLHNGEPE